MKTDVIEELIEKQFDVINLGLAEARQNMTEIILRADGPGGGDQWILKKGFDVSWNHDGPYPKLTISWEHDGPFPM